MKVLVSYTGTFELEYNMKFSEACFKDTVDDLVSSEHLPYLTRVTYMR